MESVGLAWRYVVTVRATDYNCATALAQGHWSARALSWSRVPCG
jgi:hypothetical protein